METLIILLIWGGLAGLSYLMKKKKREAAAREQRRDWRDELPSFEEWQQSVAGQAEQPPPLPAAAPPEAAARDAARSVFMDAFERQVAVQQAAERQAAAPVTVPAKATGPPPASSVAGMGVALRPETSRIPVSGLRHSKRTVHIRGRSALRRAVIAREILDRPRAFDI